MRWRRTRGHREQLRALLPGQCLLNRVEERGALLPDKDDGLTPRNDKAEFAPAGKQAADGEQGERLEVVR